MGKLKQKMSPLIFNLTLNTKLYDKKNKRRNESLIPGLTSVNILKARFPWKLFSEVL